MTKFLDILGGRLAYSDVGSGPLIVCVPGVGDLRSAYRFVAPKLAAAGYRVISLDTRGHGESSAGWDDYSVGAVAADILELIRALDAGAAHVIGNSAGAGAAVIAAAREPGAIRSLTLVGPFIRDIMPPWLTSIIFEPLLRGPWGIALWRKLFKSSFPARLPDDFALEQTRRDASFAERGRFAAVRRMFVASKAESERSTPDVTAPVLVVMGTRDSDFRNPLKEAQHVADVLHGTVATIDGAGHYPQAEMPDLFAAVLFDFFAAVDHQRRPVAHAS